MQVNISLWTGLSFIGIAQGILLSFLLVFQKRGNVKANKILAILILLFSLKSAEFAGYWTSFFLVYPHFLFTTSSFPFLFGIILYFYAAFLTKLKGGFKIKDLLHLMPFLVQVLIMMPFYLQNYEVKIEILKNIIFTDNPTLSIRFFIIKFLQSTHMLIYSFLTLQLLSKTKHSNNNVLSIENINLKWIKNLTVGFVIFIVFNLLHTLEILLFGYKYILEIDIAIIISSAVLIYALGYLTLKQPEVIAGISNLKSAPKYARSSLNPNEAALYHKKLIEAMEVEMLFKDNDLSLNDLSKKLSVSSHHLSQVLNEKLKLNFFDFVNYYRIKESKKLLHDAHYDVYTILAIAHEVGFNNKTSFNSAFRKYTGITPSQYRKKEKLQYR